MDLDIFKLFFSDQIVMYHIFIHIILIFCILSSSALLVAQSRTLPQEIGEESSISLAAGTTLHKYEVAVLTNHRLFIPYFCISILKTTLCHKQSVMG